jgi:hypothetical protein
MSNRIQVRRDTAANWTSVNPVLAPGEHGYVTDTGDTKTGDGVTAWTSLGFSSRGDGSLNATYAPVSGSPNYASPAQAAGLSAAFSIVLGG